MGIFAFRQFSVCDDRATMKVGTDAVLLGAWAPVKTVRSVLDIGTGSGVIALMMAQRTSADTKIDAVEMQEHDALQARENAAASPWPEKIKVHHTRIQDFRPQKKYDLVICNPPFFAKSLLPPAEERSNARHHRTLTQDDLIAASLRLLSHGGEMCVIMPFVEGQKFIQSAENGGLFLHHITRFFTRKGKPQERSLMLFGRESRTTGDDSLILYSEGGQWTQEYSQLTRDFYLER